MRPRSSVVVRPPRVPEDPRVKVTVAEFALLGGRPLFEAPLHVGRPNIGDRARLHERLDQILDRRWLTNDGPFVEEFEAAMAVAHE